MLKKINISSQTSVERDNRIVPEFNNILKECELDREIGTNYKNVNKIMIKNQKKNNR